jgi:hypothetical protein
MLFKEIIAVHGENYMKQVNTKRSVTDCSIIWEMYLWLSFKGLNGNSYVKAVTPLNNVNLSAFVPSFETYKRAKDEVSRGLQ